MKKINIQKIIDESLMSEAKKIIREALTKKGVETIQKWCEEKGCRKAAIRLIDYTLNRKVGISSNDLSDSVIFANGIDEIEDLLSDGDYQRAFEYAKDVADEMLNDEGFGDMFTESVNEKNTFHITSEGEPVDSFDSEKDARKHLDIYKKEHPDKEFIIEKTKYKSPEDMIDKLDEMGENNEKEIKENKMIKTKVRNLAEAVMDAKKRGLKSFKLNGSSYNVDECYKKLEEDEPCDECNEKVNPEDVEEMDGGITPSDMDKEYLESEDDSYNSGVEDETDPLAESNTNITAGKPFATVNVDPREIKSSGTGKEIRGGTNLNDFSNKSEPFIIKHQNNNYWVGGTTGQKIEGGVDVNNFTDEEKYTSFYGFKKKYPAFAEKIFGVDVAKSGPFSIRIRKDVVVTESTDTISKGKPFIKKNTDSREIKKTGGNVEKRGSQTSIDLKSESEPFIVKNKDGSWSGGTTGKPFGKDGNSKLNEFGDCQKYKSFYGFKKQYPHYAENYKGPNVNEGDPFEVRVKKNNVKESTNKVLRLKESELIKLISRIVQEAVPGKEILNKTRKASKSDSDEYMKSLEKKLKHLSLNKPEFPKQNGADDINPEIPDTQEKIGKGKNKMAVLQNQKENEEIEAERGRNPLHVDYDYEPSKRFREREKMAMTGDSKMGNAQDGAGNVIPTKTGENMLKATERIKKHDAKNSKLGWGTRIKEPLNVKNVNETKIDEPVIKESKDPKKLALEQELLKMKNIAGYNKKTQ